MSISSVFLASALLGKAAAIGAIYVVQIHTAELFPTPIRYTITIRYKVNVWNYALGIRSTRIRNMVNK